MMSYEPETITNYSDFRLQLLTKVITNRSRDIDSQLSEALSETLSLLQLDIGIISHISGDAYTVKHFQAPEGAPLYKEQLFQLGNTYCDITVKSSEVVAIDYMEVSPHKRHPCYAAFQLEAYIGAPIWIDGEQYGTINFSSPVPRQDPFTEADRLLVELLAEWAGSVLEREQTVRSLRQSQQQLQHTVDNTPGLIFEYIDQTPGTSYFAMISPWVKSVLDLEPDDLLKDATPLLQLVHPDDQDDFRQSLAAANEAKSEWQWEGRFLRADNTIVYTKATARPQLVQETDHSVAWSGFLVDVTDQKLAENRLRKQAEDLSSVAKLATMIAAIEDVTELLQTVSNQTKETFRLYHAHIYLVNEQDKTVELIAGAGEVGAAMVREGRAISISQQRSLIARTARLRKGIIVNDVQADPNFLPHPLLAETRSELAVPILAQESILGVIDLQSDEIGRFTQTDIEIQSTLAAQIGVSIQNARRYTQATQQARQLALVSEVSTAISTIQDAPTMLQTVVDVTKERFDLYHAHIHLLNDEGDTLYLTAGAGEVGRQMVAEGRQIPLASERSLVATVARTRQGNIRSYDEVDLGYRPHALLMDTKCEMAVPIVVADQVLGVLDVRSDRQPDDFDESDLQVQTVLASQIGVALQNARQFQQTEKALATTQDLVDSLDHLNDLNMDLSRVTSVDGVYKALSDRLPKIIDATRITVAQVVDEDEIELQVLITSTGVLGAGSKLNRHNSAVGEALSQERVLVFSGKSDSQRYSDIEKLAQAGLQSLMSAPMFQEGRVIGSLNVAHETPDKFTLADEQNLRQIAALVGNTIESQRLLRQTDKQASELRTVAEVSAAVATIQDPEVMLQTVVDRTKTRFNLYHCHIHLLNDIGDTLVLRAGADEVGRQMVQEGRQIPLNAEYSLVATVARTGQGQIRNYEDAGTGFMPHPLLEETRCELAVPIVIAGQILGVFDVRSDKLNYFTETDLQVQSTLAAQIAVALQNARSFAASAQARDELRSLTRRLTREGWEEFVDDSPSGRIGFMYDLNQIQQIPLAANPPQEEHTLEQELDILGETIGQLWLEETHESVEDAGELLEAVAARLSTHIENLRLTEQTEQALAETELQAKRLSQLNEASQRITAAATLNEVYQTAVREVATIINSNRVSITQLLNDHTHMQIVAISGEETDTELGMIIPFKDTVVEEAIRQKQPVHVLNSSMEGISTVLSVPLSVRNNIIGTINLGWQKTVPQTEQETRLISQLAAVLGSVIENRQLLAQAQERATRERQVRTITDRIRRQGHDKTSILEIAREEIQNMLGARKSAAWLGTQDQLKQTFERQLEESASSNQAMSDSTESSALNNHESSS